MNRLYLLIALASVALLFLVAGCSIGPATAHNSGSMASTQNEPIQAALGVRTERHLDVALLTARQMLAGEGLKAREVDIVVCGPGVEALTTGSEYVAEVAEHLDRAGRVVVCGLTLEELDIDSGSLLPGVTVVPNGLVEIFRLQQEGFLSLEL